MRGRPLSPAERRRLRDLHEITDLMARAALQPLAAAQARRDEIRALIAEIEDRRRRMVAPVSDPALAGYALAKADMLRRQKAAKYARLAAAEAEFSELREAARKALGRAEALKRLRTYTDASPSRMRKVY